MSYHIILDNEWATVRYHVADKYMYHTFHKPLGGKPFQSILNTALEYLKENKVQKWLSDDRKNAEFAPEDIQFSVTDWGPRAAKAGWKFWALVVPESLAGRAGMTDIINAFYDFGVRVAIFTDVEQARDWLVKQ